MGSYKVSLTFIVDGVEEGDAWDIAEGLQRAAMNKNYRASSGWVEPVGREGLLGSEANPVQSNAETVVRRTDGGGAMQFVGEGGGDPITLGGDDGQYR